jgi:hypothetical protein
MEHDIHFGSKTKLIVCLLLPTGTDMTNDKSSESSFFAFDSNFFTFFSIYILFFFLFQDLNHLLQRVYIGLNANYLQGVFLSYDASRHFPKISSL